MMYLFLKRHHDADLWFWVKCLNNVWWIVMEFGTDIHVLFRMNFNNFTDPLTFWIEIGSKLGLERMVIFIID